MKNRFHKAIAATALLALGFAVALPARAGVDADKINAYIETARGVFGGDKTAAAAVSEALAGAKNKATAGEIAAVVSAAEVAKNDPALVDALAGIVSAAGDEFADRAAATVAAVTGKGKAVAAALSDAALADAAKNPGSVLSATEKADLKDLYEKVLAALKGSGYAMKGEGDKVAAAGKGKGNKDKDKGGKGGKGGKGDAAAAGADAAGADATAADAAGSGSKADGSGSKADGSGSKADGSDATIGGYDGGTTESVVYDDDENLGDPLDQTIDTPSAHEYHVPPTTLSGYMPPELTPVVPVTPAASSPSKPSKPKAKPETPIYIPTGGSKPTPPPTTKPSPTPVGLV